MIRADGVMFTMHTNIFYWLEIVGNKRYKQNKQEAIDRRKGITFLSFSHGFLRLDCKESYL